MTKAAAAKSWTLHDWSDGSKASYPQPEFPSWYPESAGVAVEISLSTNVRAAANADGDGAENFAGNDPDSICTPWSGGAIVNVGGAPYLVVKGGGHTDGAYNGLIKVGPLNGDSMAASVFLAASAASAVQSGTTYTDGRQSATHTYNNLVGIDDELLEMATDARYSDGASPANAYKFTPSGQAGLASNTRNGWFGAAAYHDGKIYYLGAGANDLLRVYDLSEDSWSNEPNALMGSFATYPAAAVDTTRGGLLIVNGTTGIYWDLSDLTRTTGIGAPSSYVSSLEYDPERDAFISYVDNSLTVRELDAADPTNSSWTDRTFTGDTPAVGESNGIFGRFRYVPSLKGFFVLPTEDSSLYFFRSA